MILVATVVWVVVLAAAAALASGIALRSARHGAIGAMPLAIFALALVVVDALGRAVAAAVARDLKSPVDVLTAVVLPAVAYGAAVGVLLILGARRAERGLGIIAAALVLAVIGDIVQFRLNMSDFMPVIAFVVAVIALSVPRRWVSGWTVARLAVPFTLVGLALLLAPFVPGLGVEINGARSWIASPVGPILSGEFGRVLLFVGTAGLLARYAARLELVDARRAGIAPVAVRPLVVCLGGTAVALLLLAAQKDMGPALIVAVGIGALTTVLTGRLRFVSVAVATVAAGAVVASVVFARFQERVEIWLAPLGPEPAGLSQFGNAQTALAWAGVTGTGIGTSIQSVQPGVVTHSDNDFAFIVLAAEAGLLAVLVTLFTFAVLIGALWMGSARALAGGVWSTGPYVGAIAAMVSTHVVVNMAGLFGVIPLTGITTLFVSAGGTSLLATTAALMLAARWASESAPVTVGSNSRGLPFEARRQVRGLVAGAVALSLLVPAGFAVTRTMAVDADIVNSSGMSPQQYVADATSLGTVRSADGVILAKTEDAGVLDRAHRVYPLGALTSEVVGTTTPFGLSTGLEASWWSSLRCGVDPGADVPSDRSSCVPADIELTLDTAWENAAADALDGVNGAVVAMRASTGEVLAAVSSNRADPTFHSDRDVAVALDAATVNVSPGTWARPVPPGSVHKLAVMLAAHERWGDNLPPLNTADCPEVADIAGALSISCNSVFESLAQQLGAETVLDAAGRLGFRPTGASGIALPAPDVDASMANAGLVALGQQDVRLNLMGLAAGTATLAGEGIVHEPHLVRAVGGRLTTFDPVGSIDAEAKAAIVRAMRETVTDGTLTALAPLIGAWAGKTGTSENGDGTTNGIAVAFPTEIALGAPADIVIAVLVLPSADDPNPTGGGEAGTVIGRVLASYGGAT